MNSISPEPCPICLDSFPSNIAPQKEENFTQESFTHITPDNLNPIQAKCGHIFHKCCLSSWNTICEQQQQSTSCPICRATFIAREQSHNPLPTPPISNSHPGIPLTLIHPLQEVETIVSRYFYHLFPAQIELQIAPVPNVRAIAVFARYTYFTIGTNSLFYGRLTADSSPGSASIIARSSANERFFRYPFNIVLNRGITLFFLPDSIQNPILNIHDGTLALGTVSGFPMDLSQRIV